MGSARELPLGGGTLAKVMCMQGWRQGIVHRVVAAAIAAWVVQDIRVGRARRPEPVDVKASVQAVQDDAAMDWARWRETVPRTCAPSFTYKVPAGQPLLAQDALKHCLPLLGADGYVGLTPELMTYNADTLTLDSWSVPDCGLRFGDQLLGVMFDVPEENGPALTFELLGGNEFDEAGRISWLKNDLSTRRNFFYGDWQGVGQSGALAMRIRRDTVELSNGQQLPVLSQNSTHIVVRARDGTAATGTAVGEQIRWDICEADCELERKPDYLSRQTRSIPWAGIEAIGNSSEDKTWWQDTAQGDLDLLFTIDAATADQELDDVLVGKLQEHALRRNIPLDRMHVDVTKLWIKDRTLQLVSYYDYEPPWQMADADPRELYFPLEVYGSWLGQTKERHDWSGLGGALEKLAQRGGTVSFMVQSVGSEPCFFAPPSEDHVKQIDESTIHLRSFTSHSARMVIREVSGMPLQHVDTPSQMKTWSYWSSEGYNGDVWIGDANYVDHSHAAISLNFKVSGGQPESTAAVQSCDATSGECGAAADVDVVTDSWMGMQASSLQLPVWELLNRSGTDLSKCVDRCSVGVELRFENRLWTSWLMSPWTLLRRGRKGDVGLSVRVSGGNHHSALKEARIARGANTSVIHTAEHGGALVGVFVTGEFGYADPGFFLAHVGSLVGVLCFGMVLADLFVERVLCPKGSERSLLDSSDSEPVREPQLDAELGALQSERREASDPESRQPLNGQFPAI